MNPDNKTWTERFDERFDIGYDNQGILFRLEEDHIQRAIPLSVVKNFIRQELANQKKQIIENVKEYFGHIENDGLAGKPMNVSLKEIRDDIIKSLEE